MRILLLITAIIFGWGSTQADYQRTEAPTGLTTSVKGAFKYAAWKGERVSAQAVAWSEKGAEGLTLEVSELRCGRNVIPSSVVKASFVGYVTGDVLAEGYRQCAPRDTVNFQKMEAADLIGVSDTISLEKGTACPVWVSVEIPENAIPGTYKGFINLKGTDVCVPLGYELKVLDRVLPPPSQWSFHLNLWQNPYASARVADVPLWSPAHFEAMRPVMKLLADAGQKVVTTTILDRPWDGQTQDPFGSMVTKILRADGTWLYDYTIFDKWVEFMESVGISRQINCYSVVPWNLTFDYFDQAAGSPATVTAEPGSEKYAWYWKGFLADFAAHLKAKGWFEKTYLAMDERDEKSMRAAIDMIRSVVPDFKVALAGDYHPSVADEIDDLCIGFRSEYPEGVIEARRALGKITDYYTCCAERFPNTFMDSPRAEAPCIAWIALAKGVDGYLRWAYNSWTLDPEHDSRFRTWAAGDTYMVYPGGKSGVRFELLREGMQDVAKVQVLREQWKGDPAYAKKMGLLDGAISAFTYETLSAGGASSALDTARKLIN